MATDTADRADDGKVGRGVPTEPYAKNAEIAPIGSPLDFEAFVIVLVIGIWITITTASTITTSALLFFMFFMV